ncbi:hypothetical protein OEA41_007602 [Lepraria neglecta]|uniref:Uncharacterized protein n=1 Tax=Lepraria neglecta TaxID=209136 RepID=A0AAE0DN85_9LECA|nr:hypothetical protein OEA41_007602 [Lepraria neglecta]
MLSKIPTLRVVTLTASLCFDFVGKVSGGDVKRHDPQLLQYRITATLESLMSLPQAVTIQRLEHRIWKRAVHYNGMLLVQQTFAECVDDVISARHRETQRALDKNVTEDGEGKAEDFAGALPMNTEVQRQI